MLYVILRPLCRQTLQKGIQSAIIYLEICLSDRARFSSNDACVLGTFYLHVSHLDSQLEHRLTLMCERTTPYPCRQERTWRPFQPTPTQHTDAAYASSALAKLNTADGHCSAAQSAERRHLLSLPPEIRNRIYENVFGNRTAHIDVRSTVWPREWINLYSPLRQQLASDFKVSHVVCISPVSFEEAYAFSKDLDAAPRQSERSYSPCHFGCLMKLCGSSPRHIGSMQWGPDQIAWASSLPSLENVQMSLALLRTCRQIYREAALIPYATSVFVFRSPDMLESFVESLPVRQREAIRCLQVEDMPRKPREEIIRALKGLKRVQLCLGIRAETKRPDPRNVSGFRAESVKVVLNGDIEYEIDRERREAKTRRRQWAAEIEERLRKGKWAV